jgi:hypothetical protein
VIPERRETEVIPPNFFANLTQPDAYIIRSEPRISRIYTDYRSVCLISNLRDPWLFFTMS